jgi:hypothetical protein
MSLFVRQRTVEQQFGCAQYSVHGRADFVTHIGQKLALRFAGGLCGFLGRTEFLFGAFSVGRIDVDADHARGHAIQVSNQAAAGQDPAIGAVSVSKAMFKFELGSLAIQAGLDGLLHERLVVRMDPRSPFVEAIGSVVSS